MRQRLGIARAPVNDPKVVFLDEPTLGLDPSGQLQILDLIAHVAHEYGATVVLSTHLLAEVEQVCDQVLILNKGRVAAEGTVDEVARQAAAPRLGVLRVPVNEHDRALALLLAQGIVARSGVKGRRGEVEVSFPGDVPPDVAGPRALKSLIDSGVPVVGYELEGGRLSDAFLAVTGALDESDIDDPSARSSPGWLVVAERELRDLWFGGRALPLMLAYTAMLSLTSYLVATNQALNFLELRESVSLTLRVAVAVSALLVVLGAADSVSGERERGTLESLLLSPVSRSALIIAKGLAAMSLWLAALLLSIPHLWFLGRGVGIVGKAVVGGLFVSALLAAFLAGLGLLISTVSMTNRLSLSLSLFLLVSVYAPSQLATVGLQPTAGDLLQRLDPFTSGLRYLDKLIVDGHAPLQDVTLLVSPLVAAVLCPAAALIASRRLQLWTRREP